VVNLHHIAQNRSKMTDCFLKALFSWKLGIGTQAKSSKTSRDGAACSLNAPCQLPEWCSRGFSSTLGRCSSGHRQPCGNPSESSTPECDQVFGRSRTSYETLCSTNHAKIMKQSLTSEKRDQQARSQAGSTGLRQIAELHHKRFGGTSR
jgi:hypothetical protein